MTSAAKIVANSQNAQLSTGPRTVDGKARSSQNALKHGLTSKDVVVRVDEIEEFETLRDSLLVGFGPHGPIETLAYNQLLHAAWNLRRFRRLEADLMVDGLDPLLDASHAVTIDRLNRYAARAERSYAAGVKDLRSLQTNRVLRCLHWTELQRETAPVLVSPKDVNTQAPERTHQDPLGGAMQLALQMIDHEGDRLLQRSREVRRQNEPMEAA